MIAQVCIPNTPFDCLDYAWDDLPCEEKLIGSRVIVPFRKSQAVGIIIGFSQCSDCPPEKLRPVREIIDETSLLSETSCQFYRWLGQYYQSALGEVLAQALPVKFREGKPFHSSSSLLLHGRGRREASGEGKTSQFQEISIYNADPPKQLNDEQKKAVQSIISQQDAFHCFLLQGITGSGKTEVYLQAAQAALEKQQQILILVPEIGLTPQLLERFQKRFSHYAVALMHSSLNDTERWHVWCAAQKGEIDILIGTRSAVFTPMPKLGLIVIDEEHDTSFKQQDSLRYSARDTAVMRAQKLAIPIVLGSATPSLETLHNAQRGKYIQLRLTYRAVSLRSPKIQLIDMRNQRVQHGLSLTLLDAIKNKLDKKEQVLIFVNRRGYAPVLLCHQCRWIAHCQHCDARMTIHRKKNILQCHHCDHQKAIPELCGQCAQPALVPVGVGTERLEEYLQQYFPEAKILRVDRDTTQRKNALKEKLDQIHSGEADILIGTQMLAKGHHFPQLTLAVIINADMGFFSHDFRAAEKTGQLILQVAGRAGREDKEGTVMIQTYVPDNPLLVTLLRDGYSVFAEQLLVERKATGFPPFGYMALLRAQSKNPDEVKQFLKNLKEKIFKKPQDDELLLLGPAPSPLEKKAGFYRMQLLMMSDNRTALFNAMQDLRKSKKLQEMNAYRLTMDIDPIDLG